MNEKIIKQMLAYFQAGMVFTGVNREGEAATDISPYKKTFVQPPTAESHKVPDLTIKLRDNVQREWNW